MTSFSGQVSWTKMTSSKGELAALACHPTKKVNKAEHLTVENLMVIRVEVIAPEKPLEK